MRKLSDNFIIISIIFAAFFFLKGTYWYESWAVKWATLMVVISIILAFRMFWNISVILAACVSYTLFCGISIFATRGWHYESVKLLDLMAIKFSTAFTSFCFVMVLSFVYSFRRKLHLLTTAMVHIAWLNIPFTYVKWFNGNWELNFMGGIFGNPSINFCFMVVITPFVVRYFLSSNRLNWEIALYLTTLIPLLIFSEKVLPLLAGGAIVMAFFYKKTKKIPVLLITAISLSLIGYTASHTNNFKEFHAQAINDLTHYRSKVWVWALDWWYEHSPTLADGTNDYPNINIAIGAGLGSTPVLVPRIQAMKNDKEGYFMWFHSEPIQALFEIGIIGFVLYLLLAAEVLIKAYREPYLFATCVGYMIVMLANYPLHMAIQALFCAILVIASLGNYSLFLKDKQKGF